MTNSRLDTCNILEMSLELRRHTQRHKAHDVLGDAVWLCAQVTVFSLKEMDHIIVEDVALLFTMFVCKKEDGWLKIAQDFTTIAVNTASLIARNNCSLSIYNRLIVDVSSSSSSASWSFL
jgi:hypothetical protein